MALQLLENELTKVLTKLDELTFPKLIRLCRTSLGITQRKASEFIGCLPNRLKNLENGKFRDMPNQLEIVGISRLYDINPAILLQKMYEYADKKQKQKAAPPQRVNYFPENVYEVLTRAR